jgi:hypothetical protein
MEMQDSHRNLLAATHLSVENEFEDMFTTDHSLTFRTSRSGLSVDLASESRCGAGGTTASRRSAASSSVIWYIQR